MSEGETGGGSVFQRWLDALRENDPPLYRELEERLQRRVTKPEALRSPESGVSLESASFKRDVRTAALETIVREGRPALLIRENRILLEGKAAVTAADEILSRLRDTAGNLEPLIPLVGRIDVDNHPGPLTYVGTGWLVDRNIVVTNRHVAELIARTEDGAYRFRPGRFGEPLRVSLDYRHEHGVDGTAVSRVLRVVWIEPDAAKADIAFLEVERRADGSSPEFIPLSPEDAEAGSHVAVVGYPARAPAHLIPNQSWMDQIYGSTYDVKRIAPGLAGPAAHGWATHDCTTLGGNSGSVVLDMKTGSAVALHFAGLYMIENYAVPASTIREYLAARPWHPSEARAQGAEAQPLPPDPARPQQPVGVRAQPHTSAAHGGSDSRRAPDEVSIVLPLKITLSLGEPQTASSAATPPLSVTTAWRPDSPAPRPIKEAAFGLARECRAEGMCSVWAGYKIEHGRLTDAECLVVSARPGRLEAVSAAVPATYEGFPVEVRPAAAEEQLTAASVAEAPLTSVMYNDEDRAGPDYSFDWVNEVMKVRLHVGPERSWTELSRFLQGAREELVTSIYEFHAAHIAEAIGQKLDDGVSLTLVMARQSRDPSSGKTAEGDFARGETFGRWDEQYGERFARIVVPVGAQGMVANAYHIKVTARDRTALWLSSGNWKRTSQPLIDGGELDNPRITGGAGNREWHVIIENETLAGRFRNHVLADLRQSMRLGGTREAVEDEVMVDVPSAAPEAVEFEALPARVLEPREIHRRVRVKPLLTPDGKGAVFSKAVLRLIRSAKRQLLFQNQYIKMGGADGGFLKELTDALGEKAGELDDFRIILRAGNGTQTFDLSQLKRRGVDIARQVRVLSNTHTKGMIVDGRLLLVGSHNWSSAGVTLNRDASLIFDDEEVAQYYAEAFELDWDRAREPRFDEPPTQEVRPAEGEAPPPGFLRMTLSEYLEA